MSLKSQNFRREEFACKCGCGFNPVDAELLGVLEDLRATFKKPVLINSACRCIGHNKAVGGSPDSQHLWGKAVDVRVEGVHADEVAEYFETKFSDTYGIGQYEGRTHIDVRTKKARWDERENLFNK